jgi:hypothetical protein
MFGRLALAVLAALVLTSAPAAAALRIATPSGDAMSSGDCASVQTACTLTYAVNNADAKDEIDVLTGRYEVSQTLQLPAGVIIHGHANNLRPRIVSTAANVAMQTTGTAESHKARISDLVLSGAAGRLLAVNDFGATIERVSLDNHRDGGVVFADATISGTVTLRSSILRADGADAVAGAFQSADAKVRNVTFYATGGGSRGLSATCASVDVASSIAHGGGVDVAVDRLGCLGASGLMVTHSSFQTRSEGGGATLTSGGGNIAADPATIFVKPDGDYHELPGAPTIDAGAPADKFSSLTDVEAFAWGGAAPDMGATQFFGAGVTTPVASGVTATRAVLEGRVSASGHSGLAFFEFAPPDGAFRQPAEASTVVAAGAADHPVTVTLTGLLPATTYRARLTVTQGNFNYVRSFVSDEVTFTTAAVPVPRPRRCVVPKLRGLTLERARARLRRAHCRLGKVSGRKRGRGTARVRSQRRRAGRRLPAGTKVGVRVRYRVTRRPAA